MSSIISLCTNVPICIPEEGSLKMFNKDLCPDTDQDKTTQNLHLAFKKVSKSIAYKDAEKG